MTIELREYETVHGVALNHAQVRALGAAAKVTVVPSDVPGYYDLTPGSTVGVMQVAGQQFSIAPKVGIPRLLFLLSYALRRSWHGVHTALLDDEATLVEAMAVLYADAVDRALRRGVRRGYLRRHEAGTRVRGRLDVATQLRRHHGRLLPIEIDHDAYTLDTPANRLLLTATLLLRGMPIRSRTARQQLARTLSRLEGAAPLDPRRGPAPPIRLDRLSEHYAEALTLARLIMRVRSVEATSGASETTSLLFNMNTVFEDFVVESLRERLGLDEHSFPQNGKGRSLTLDVDHRIRLEPDLSWWEAGQCVFVGDVKYKKLTGPGIKHPDLYQLVSYMVASDLPRGLTVYAAGKSSPTTHVVRNAGKRLTIASMDISGGLPELAGEVSRIAELVLECAVLPPGATGSEVVERGVQSAVRRVGAH